MKDMLGRENVITAERALALLKDGLSKQSPEEVQLRIKDTLGMVCSRDIISREDLPQFARSTVDGYAVKAGDTFGATETMPAYMNLSEEVFMGVKPEFVLNKGDASRIPTGGMLPENSDAVVMFEHVQAVDEKCIEVLKPVAPGENVIQAGEDVSKGEIIFTGGHRIRPQDLGACAGLGITGLWVFKKPSVSIISTGDEIIPAEGSPVEGQVRDINSYVLAGMISRSGAVPLRKGIFRDDYNTIREVIESSLIDSQTILISGGTSVGTKDMIAGIINDIGNPGLLFHGVSLKPGKPMIGGMINGTPVFGLPGHPAAVSICFEIFIEPVLEILSGCKKKFSVFRKHSVTARLSKNISSVQGREEHVRVQLEEREDGLWAVPVLGKSGLIKTLVKADGTVVVPLHKNGIEQGELVEVRLF
jgi:molybdopterin molybdotransferase